MSYRNKPYAFGLLSLALTIGACSSSSPPPDNTGPGTDTPISSLSDSVGSLSDVERLGWFVLIDDAEFDEISGFATFFVLNEQDRLENPLTEVLDAVGDTCTVEELSFDAPTQTDELLNDFTSLSAGEILTLTSSNGSYGELSRRELQSGIGYVSPDDLPYPSPTVLTASVPGDEFPAASVTVEAPSAVTNLTLDLNELVEEGTSIQWTASDSNDTILAMSFNDSTNIDTFIECYVIDDGEFTLPAIVHGEADALSPTDAQLTFDGAARVRAGSSRQGSDLFIFVRSTP